MRMLGLESTRCAKRYPLTLLNLLLRLQPININRKTLTTMAKESAAKKTSTPSYTVPEGLRKFTGDVLGFHDLETQGPIHGIPMGAKISDNKLNVGKPNSFVIFKLLSPCEYTEGTGDDAVTLKANKDDCVGVWMKGGMRALRMTCGLEVFMVHTGEKVLKGRPAGQDPMKTYDFHIGKGPQKLIPIIEDTREKSINEKSMFDVKAKPGREPGEDIDEEVGF